MKASIGRSPSLLLLIIVSIFAIIITIKPTEISKPKSEEKPTVEQTVQPEQTCLPELKPKITAFLEGTLPRENLEEFAEINCSKRIYASVLWGFYDDASFYKLLEN